MAALMAGAPLLRRYRVTERGATASLAEALRRRDPVLAALDGRVVNDDVSAIVMKRL